MHTIKQGKKGRRSTYSPGFKRKVIEELLLGALSKAELSRKYQISERSVRLWLGDYERDQHKLLTLPSMSQEGNISTNQDTDQSAQIQALQQELRLAKIKLTCLETLIDVAEETLHIDIRKKPGTKPSEE